MAVKSIPDGFHTVTPFILVKDGDKLIDFLKAAFGATLKSRYEYDGKLMHAEVTIGDSIVMIGQASDKYPPMPVMLYLYVNDVDAAYKKAITAGGKSLREPTNEFYGDRSSGVIDAWDNQWWIATHVEDVSDEEMKKREAELAKQGANK